jgi:DNA repair protein RadC
VKDLAEKNIHSGHRERVKESFRKTGFEGFSDINVLEMVLFYSVPRKDTNELAHRLLDEFGSLSGVFDAPYEMLIKVKGISPNTATHIKMMKEVYKRYEKDRYTGKKTILNNSEASGEYCVSLFHGETEEKLYVILLDSSNAVIKYSLISQGTVNRAEIDVRKIIEQTVTSHAVGAIITHNHPYGVAAPSADDINATQVIANALQSINVRLRDHIIVCGSDYTALALSSKFRYIFR